MGEQEPLLVGSLSPADRACSTSPVVHLWAGERVLWERLGLSPAVYWQRLLALADRARRNITGRR